MPFCVFGWVYMYLIIYTLKYTLIHASTLLAWSRYHCMSRFGTLLCWDCKYLVFLSWWIKLYAWNELSLTTKISRTFVKVLKIWVKGYFSFPVLTFLFLIIPKLILCIFLIKPTIKKVLKTIEN